MPFHLLPSDPSPPQPAPGQPARPPATTRRRFLAGLSAGGVALGWGLSGTTADDAQQGGGWYALVADTHVAADLSCKRFGQTMAENLRAVVADILASDEPPRGVFIDGDLALWDGRPGDYRSLLTLLEPLRTAKVPVHLALGNHDDRGHFRDAVPAATCVEDRQVSVVDGPGLRFLVLDSLEQVRETPGRLGPGQLDWLVRDLDAHPRTPTVLIVHHHPEPVPWTKFPGLRDSEALMQVLRPRGQVKAVIFGHNHTWRVRLDGGIYLINLPAVGYTFDHNQPLGWCRFRPEPDGASWELRCVAGTRATGRHRFRLLWPP
jgi:3',5'-cyclic AMP phosphodiesterase CpdA